ncbi:hypothetical protein Tco_0154610 [Tanacetum coccineum]
MQQTPVPTPATALSYSLQDLPNFGSLFGFDHRLKTLETDFSKLKQTNQFAAAVSLILGVVDAYLSNKMHEAVKTAVQLQSDRLRDEAQAENADFINKLDDNIKKIINDQVKEQVKAQVSKILPKIKKTVNEQLVAEVLTHSSNESKTSNADKDEEPSAGSNRGSKRRRAGKEPESTSAPKEKTSKTTGKSTKGSKSHQKSADESAQAEEPMQTAKDLEEPKHQEFKTGVTEDQPDEETSQLPDWFQKPAKPPTPDRDWNKTLSDAHGPVQPWLISLAQMEDPRDSFNELMDTPLDFSAFVMNRLKVDTLTPELLAGPTFKLMKESCKSMEELEYFFEEVYKETTDQLYWNNPEGQQYPHDLRKPLQLIPNSRGHRLKIWSLTQCGVKCRLATTNMHSGESHIGGENDNNSMDLLLTENLLEMSTPNAESLLLHIQDIEDMLLLLVQGKLTNLTVEERLAFNVSLRMFTRSIVIQRRVEDLQLGVELSKKA